MAGFTYHIAMRKFRNNIICGDCIEILGKVQEPFADLIFADPPFNIGYQYDKYKDKVKSEKYIAWTKDWMDACFNVLKPNGSFYIAIGDDYAANIKVIADELGLVMRNWIIWHYTFGQQTKAKFARAHTHIFYFVKDKKEFTFNDYAVRVPSDRQLKYNDKRANPKGKMPDDVWNEYSRVCGTFNERLKWHPCQMPENVLARIVSVSSNSGDVVLDPFNGSGTTAAVAKKLGRDYCGIDISQNYIDNCKKRLGDITDTTQFGNENGSLDAGEMLELRRLYFDINISAKEITANEKLLEVFARQFEVRMNNSKKYSNELLGAAIGEFGF